MPVLPLTHSLNLSLGDDRRQVAQENGHGLVQVAWLRTLGEVNKKILDTPVTLIRALTKIIS